jgi:hypothetical protein
MTVPRCRNSWVDVETVEDSRDDIERCPRRVRDLNMFLTSRCCRMEQARDRERKVGRTVVDLAVYPNSRAVVTLQDDERIVKQAPLVEFVKEDLYKSLHLVL